MRVTLLGTAAAEAIPALWCECEVCRTAAARGGKELRRRCSYLIDDDTLVDFGPDAFWQSIDFKIDLTRIRRIIFTHPHSDHLNPVDLSWRRPGLSRVTQQLQVVASQPLFDYLFNHFVRHFKDRDPEALLELLKIERRLVSAGTLQQVDDITLLPLAANHAPGLEPLIYLIERRGRRLLIANDTGWLADEAWEALAGRRLDAAIIESTCGKLGADVRNDHMGLNVTVEFRDKLREIGCLDENSQVITNHFSHNGGMNHDEMVERYGQHGIVVAYDGMRLEV